MAEEIAYRKATVDDALQVSILFKIVYVQTYGQDGVSKEFANYIDKRFSVEYLTKAIEAGNILIATYKGNPVAAAEIRYNSQSPVNNFISPELSKLYILESFCGKGIGRRLLQEVEKTIHENGHNKIWLRVYTLNPRAINFYAREGYSIIGTEVYEMEENDYLNYIMAKEF